MIKTSKTKGGVKITTRGTLGFGGKREKAYS